MTTTKTTIQKKTKNKERYVYVYRDSLDKDCLEIRGYNETTMEATARVRFDENFSTKDIVKENTLHYLLTSCDKSCVFIPYKLIEKSDSYELVELTKDNPEVAEYLKTAFEKEVDLFIRSLKKYTDNPIFAGSSVSVMACRIKDYIDDELNDRYPPV